MRNQYGRDVDRDAERARDLNPGPAATGSRGAGPSGALPATRPMLRPRGHRSAAGPLSRGHRHGRVTVSGRGKRRNHGNCRGCPLLSWHGDDTTATGTARGRGQPGHGPVAVAVPAGDFLTCPLLYRFRVIDRLPEPPSPAAARGTLVHAVLERLFDQPPPGRTPQAARSLVEPEWDRLAARRAGAGRPVRRRGGATGRLAGEAPAHARPVLHPGGPAADRARPPGTVVEAELASGLRLRGYIDRLDVAPGGEIRIVDYKTGTAPPAGVRGAGPVPDEVLRARDVARAGPGADHAPADVPGQRRDRAVPAGRVRPARHRAQGRGAVAGDRARHRSRDWRPRPGRVCDWCAHQAICPAFGGTPPPIPEDLPASMAEVPGVAEEAPPSSPAAASPAAAS